MDTKERARIESAGGFVEFNRFSVASDKFTYLWNQSERELGFVASHGGLCVQDEWQA